MSSSFNSRGQLKSIVDLSVEEGDRREKVFKDYMYEKKSINMIKKSKFKHYDFVLSNNKNIKIEYKSVNASIKTFQNVFIGLDKICYYLYRRQKKPDMIFYLVYGFYDIDEIKNEEKIQYMYCEIDLNKYIKEYGTKIIYNKKHIEVPVCSLKSLKYLVEILGK